MHNRWLLVFDNVQDPAIVAQYLPRGVHYSYTISTNNENIDNNYASSPANAAANIGCLGI